MSISIDITKYTNTRSQMVMGHHKKNVVFLWLHLLYQFNIMLFIYCSGLSLNKKPSQAKYGPI